uniref:Uncharacterized protein n=1 Tax=Panagrolaimus superbus TaxID=310955 RepID=A0A914Z7J2_9BILA
MFQVKCKSHDINGKTTLVPASPVNDGETYYIIISIFDECETETNPSQMVPLSPMTSITLSPPMTPRTSQQHRRIFDNFSSPSRSFSVLSFDTSPSEVRGFPGSQIPDYINPTSYNPTPLVTTFAVDEVQNRPALVQTTKMLPLGKNQKNPTTSILSLSLVPINARCLWIAKMVKEDKAKIPEIVIAKFPVFKTNGAWVRFNIFNAIIAIRFQLQHDFVYTLENAYKLPVFNVS